MQRRNLQGSRKQMVRFRVFRSGAHLYRLRVRQQPLQEVLALIGIAAGVALLFAVQVASGSVTGAVRQLAHGVTGNATLEMASRSSQGMSQRFVADAEQLKFVKTAAPVLQRQVTVAGTKRAAPVNLVGIDERLERAGGELVAEFASRRDDLDALGLFLMAPAARTIGAEPGRTVVVASGGTQRRAILAGTIGASEIGALAKSPVAVATLGTAQRITGMPRRISRVLIQPERGREAAVKRQLVTLAAGRFDVRASDSEVELLAAALKPDRQSSLVFSAVAVIIGLLFAYNAMLLSVSRRRRMVAGLRMIGADRATVIAMLTVEAVVLGAFASLLGIFAGKLLLGFAYQSVPEYLTAGFAIGSQQVIEFKAVALSVLGGMAAAMLASFKPALNLFRVDASEVVQDGESSHAAEGVALGAKSLWSGLAIVAICSAIALRWPAFTPLGIFGIFAALICVIGPLMPRVLKRIHRATRVRGGVATAVAVEELSSSPARATALALIAAGAVAATVAIGGARVDLQRGVDQLIGDFFGTSQLWVAPRNPRNVFVSEEFEAQAPAARIRAAKSVESLSIHHGIFIDMDARRLRVVARPATDPKQLIESQVIDGDPKVATQRIRSGGWITLTKSVAAANNHKIGDPVSVPTPSGILRLRLAATSANYGWPSGTIVMNDADYRRGWGDAMASSLAVQLKPGTSVAAGKAEIQAALGPDSALAVRTTDEMLDDRNRAFTQGLARLRQISVLVLGAGVLAIVAAMFAAVWQRRTRLASMRAIGFYRSEVYRTLFAEMTLIVLLGGICGLVFGLAGQVFASRWTEVSTGYKTASEPAVLFGVVTLLKVVMLAAAATAGPAYFASRIGPRASESE